MSKFLTKRRERDSGMAKGEDKQDWCNLPSDHPSREFSAESERKDKKPESQWRRIAVRRRFQTGNAQPHFCYVEPF